MRMPSTPSAAALPQSAAASPAAHDLQTTKPRESGTGIPEPLVGDMPARHQATLATSIEEALDRSPTMSPRSFRDRAVEVLARYLDSNVRAALGRESAIRDLDSQKSEVHTQAAERIGKLLGSDTPVARGASVQDAVEALRERLHDRKETEEVRSASLRSLAKYYTEDGRLEAGFSREVAHLFKSEENVGMAARMAHTLGKSGDALAQSVLLEALSEAGSMVASSAAAGLKGSMRLSHSPEIETRLKAIFQDPHRDPQHRAMAVLAFSGRAYPVQISTVSPLLASPETPPLVRLIALEAFRGSTNSLYHGAVLQTAAQDRSSPGSLVSSARSVAASFARGTVVVCESGDKIKI